MQMRCYYYDMLAGQKDSVLVADGVFDSHLKVTGCVPRFPAAPPVGILEMLRPLSAP